MAATQKKLAPIKQVYAKGDHVIWEYIHNNEAFEEFRTLDPEIQRYKLLFEYSSPTKTIRRLAVSDGKLKYYHSKR
jgi:hypothetical protein